MSRQSVDLKSVDCRNVQICGNHGGEGGRRNRGFCNACYHRLLRHGDPNGGETRYGTQIVWLQEVVDRYLAGLLDPVECVIWPVGWSTVAGYGQIRWEGRPRTAHRTALILSTGQDPPDNIQACHAPVVCHQRACVNPHHLRWATNAENSNDRTLDGTEIRGEQLSTSKLTETNVREVVGLLNVGALTQTAIASLYGVAAVTISDIHRGKRWGWFTGRGVEQ